jgi:hypothetical protein
MKFKNLNLIWNELNLFEGKIIDNIVHSGFLYNARPIRIGKVRPISGLLPRRHRRVAGEIRPAAVEWPGSKPAE